MSSSTILRVDLHSHTSHSIDAWMPPRTLVRRARSAGLDRIAVTDHGAIDGALRARDIDPELIIVGEEVRCDNGTELVALFIERHVPDGLPVGETAARIREQGGVVYAPHPFAYPGTPHAAPDQALDVADLVEAFNSRAFLPRWNRAALRAIAERGLPAAASSDAHFPWEIGRAFTEMPAFRSAEEFRRALRHARPLGRRKASPVVHVASIGLHFIRKRIWPRRPGW